MKLTKQVSLFLDLYLFFYDFCKLKHTQVQQGFVITVYLLQNTHAGDQQAAVLQRSGTKRGALGSQAHAQGRGVAGESHWRRRGRGAAADGRRDGVQRWWRRGSTGVPARRGRRGFEGRNQSQGGRRCSPREKSKGGSPEVMNRSSLAATMVERARV